MQDIKAMIQEILADTDGTLAPYMWAGYVRTKDQIVAEIIYRLEATHDQDFQGLESVVELFI